MKEAWKREIVSFKEEKLRKVSKKEFTSLWSRAYLAAFTSETILAAFCVTGIHPFSRVVITEAQIKPSITTSTKGSFPLPQPSPVRVVMAAFHANPLTAFATSPSTHIPHHPTAANENRESDTVPTTPGRQKREIDIDPSLFTPSKRMRTLYAHQFQSLHPFLRQFLLCLNLTGL